MKFVYLLQSPTEHLGAYTNKKRIWEISTKILGVGTLETGEEFAHNFVKLCRLFKFKSTVLISNLTSGKFLKITKVKLNE